MQLVRFVRYPVTFAMFSAVLASIVFADAPNPSITPVPQRGVWMAHHDIINARVKQGNVDLIFIGDSITDWWGYTGAAVWMKYYAKRNAVNLGAGGDQTCHVLWRLDHGNIDGISPKLAVIMIGTNNAGHTPHQAPEQIAAGIKAIVERLRTKLPKTKILLLAIFPRGANNDDPLRKINMKANELASQLADNEHVFFLDIGPKFLAADGSTLPKEIMPDLLHPSGKGYEIWAEAIEPTVAKLMGEK
jgi:lysophospholipase L1-like esterase